MQLSKLIHRDLSPGQELGNHTQPILQLPAGEDPDHCVHHGLGLVTHPSTASPGDNACVRSVLLTRNSPRLWANCPGLTAASKAKRLSPLHSCGDMWDNFNCLIRWHGRCLSPPEPQVPITYCAVSLPPSPAHPSDPAVPRTLPAACPE